MIRIVLDIGRELDYRSDGIPIRLNRITDDFQNPDKRYGEYSYSFSLPRTKNNDFIFEFPDVRGRTRIFQGKQFEAKLYSDSELLMSGIVELAEIDAEEYGCIFYSRYSQLLDSIKSKKLVDMQALPIIDFDYENTIIAHINQDYKDADEIDYQFPFIFYQTPFISGFTATTAPENYMGYVYNFVETTLPYEGINPVTFHRFPPAIYLKSIIKGMLADAGWTLGGSFFERSDIKKIIIPFVGDAETYSGAVVTDNNGSRLDLNKMLPDVSQLEFFKSIINAFNLYFIIDNENRIIRFETYNLLFADNSNPVDITGKVDRSTMKRLKAEPIPKLLFGVDEDNNSLVAGYGRSFSYPVSPTSEDYLNPSYWLNPNRDVRKIVGGGEIHSTYTKDAFEKLWNKTTGEKEVKVMFSPCNYYPYTLINEKTVDNNPNTSDYVDLYTVGIPIISPQTPNNSNETRFHDPGNPEVTFVTANAEIEYKGGIKMLYYYGKAAYNLPVGSQSYFQFCWIAVATGIQNGEITFERVVLPIASPYKLMSNAEKDLLIDRVETWNTSDYSNWQEVYNRQNELGAEAHGLFLTYYSLADTSLDSHETTEFSLTFGANPRHFADTLYSYFYQKKFETLANGHQYRGTIHINEYDWSKLQIYTPILYDGELYQLVSLKNFDPVKETAEITILKKS